MAGQLIPASGTPITWPAFDSSFRGLTIGSASIGSAGKAGLVTVASTTPLEAVSLIGAAGTVGRLKQVRVNIISGGTSAGQLEVYLAKRVTTIPTSSGTAVTTVGQAVDSGQAIQTSACKMQYCPATVTNGTGGAIIDNVSLLISATAGIVTSYVWNFAQNLDLAPSLKAVTESICVGFAYANTYPPGAAATAQVAWEWEECLLTNAGNGF